MARNNETVAEIVKRVRRECNSYPLPTNAAEMLRLLREISAAHDREIAAKDAEIAKLRTLTTHTDNSEVIAELQRRLKVAEDALKECRGFAERYETDDDYMQSDICSDIRGAVYNALATIHGKEEK